MNCPICGTQLKTAVKYNVGVDFCPACKGIWFDKDEIKQLSDNVKNVNFPEPDIKKLVGVKTGEKAFQCPKCAEKMLKVSPQNSKLIFDYCPNEHGYWFEEKEFEQYVRENLSKK